MGNEHDTFIDSGLQLDMEWCGPLLVSCGVSLHTAAIERLQSPHAAKMRALFARYMQGKVVNWPVEYDWSRVRPFQNKVLHLLLDVPHGKTVTYGELARRAGNPKAARAVGLAMHTNPWGLLVPCHRVLGAGGKLTGYAGGLNLKEILLQIERYEERSCQAK